MANEIHFQEATTADFETIQKLAREIFFQAYAHFISADQLNYMLDNFYSHSALANDITLRQTEYFLLVHQSQIIGFMGLEPHFSPQTTKIHKLYILAAFQGNKIGKSAIEFAANFAHLRGDSSLTLNVNRSNTAQIFYEKMGFFLEHSVDIPFGNGYVMDDYVLRKNLP